MSLALSMDTKKDLIRSKYKGKCAYCGDEVAKSKMTVDHVIPKSSFDAILKSNDPQKIPSFLRYLPKDTRSGYKDNLLPACRSCNGLKGTETLDKFRVLLKARLVANNKYPKASPMQFHFEKEPVSQYELLCNDFVPNY